MFVGYEFERDFADKACTLEHVMSQVGADMGVYVFLQLSELSEFAEIAQQYKGHVATDFPHSGMVMVSAAADFPARVRPVLVEECRPVEHASEESGDGVMKLMQVGAFLVYRLDFAGAAGFLQEEVFIDTNNRGLISGLL